MRIIIIIINNNGRDRRQGSQPPLHPFPQAWKGIMMAFIIDIDSYYETLSTCKCKMFTKRTKMNWRKEYLGTVYF